MLCPGHSTPEKTWYPLCRRPGGLQGWSGCLQKISPPPGFNPRTIQTSESLYRPSYPSPHTSQHHCFTFCYWSASVAVMQYYEWQKTLVSFPVFMVRFAQMMVLNVITQHKRVVIFCPFRGMCCHPDGGKVLL